MVTAFPAFVCMFALLGCGDREAPRTSLPKTPVPFVAGARPATPQDVMLGKGRAKEHDAAYYLVSLGQVKRREGKTLLVLKDKYAPGLVSLGDFSHVMVFYWFHKNDTPEKRSFLQGYRRGKKDPLTGVFATRSAARPNLIAITTCRIISVRDNIIEIDGIDAFDDSPILDLKPYIPRNDSFPQAQIPVWVR